MALRLAEIGGAPMRECLDGFFSSTVTILTPTGTQDEYGQVVDAWGILAEHASLPCLIAGGDVSIRMKAQEFRTSQVTYEVERRRLLLKGYYPTIDQQHRARFESRDWAIIAVVHDPSHTWTELGCQSIEPGAI
jgi:hypothetical protein